MCKEQGGIVIDLKLKTFAFIIVSIIMLSASVCAQDGSGRSGAVSKSPAATGAKKRIRTRPPWAVPRPVPPPARVAETGRLAIIVNEGGSQVQLSRAGSTVSETISANSKARSLIQRTLEVGSYNLTVKKPGFFDEFRTVDIVGGKRRRAEINLRPMMARLSVIANVRDARIDVDGVGSYDRAIRKMFVRPGIYRISVRRRGYQSFRATLDLKVAGQEKVVSVVLRPIRIETILSEASANIARGQYEAAADQTNDVLLMNPAHAKANRLFGLIEFQRRIPTAASFMLKAVSSGETVTLPIKILEGVDTAKLIDAELTLNRDGVGIRSASRFDLNYTVALNDVLNLRREIDGNSVAYIALDGRSDFHGRPIEPRLKIYSREAFTRSGSPSVSCMNSSTSRSCNAAADIIYKLLSDWRSANKGLAQLP